jgi:L-fucono-1,5-lactonase
MTVDAHHHLWDPRHRSYPWLSAPELAPIRRPFGLADLTRDAADAGVDQTVLVQTVPDLDETEEFLATAGKSAGLIAGVVGWIDLTDPGVSDTIVRLRAGDGGDRLVGVRHQVQDEADPAWLLRADVSRGLTAVAAAGLVFDLLVRVRQLAAAHTVVSRHPQLRFVIDHAAKPPIASGGWEPWARGVRALAVYPNVYCKLSGLVTEAAWDRWSINQIRPYAEHVLEAFKPSRTMFGSDWPVCTLAASYRTVHELASKLTGTLNPAERHAVFHATAVAVYRLG